MRHKKGMSPNEYVLVQAMVIREQLTGLITEAEPIDDKQGMKLGLKCKHFL